MPTTQLKPDYIFEVSWEVCNKVGGIHTVITTKAKTLLREYGDRLIMIGPDVWKGQGENPEFIENKSLFRAWREHAEKEGLKLKIGRWNTPGNPIAILVDFSSLFVKKNEIFADLWVQYQLDSLTGQWDYIEPALFGYAVGQAIECFYRYHLNATDNIIAQFHEWMTGTGLLYLKQKAPQIATVFTTHATVLGRSIAGNGLPFYSNFDKYNPDKVACDFNVIAKHSLEKTTAMNADAFTTVSEITTRECEKFLGKKPDFITHNGFDPSIVPTTESFEKKRAVAKAKILSVAEALTGRELDKDSLLIIKSGRYEYKNKGIDIFIDSLAQLNEDKNLKRNAIGVIFVPAHQTGPRKDLLERLQHPEEKEPHTGDILTHYLQGADNDPIIKEIKKVGLDNSPDHKVKIIFVPTYLDGRDGIFNLSYYDTLIGFDLAIFPSYYEPWGYTPLEGLAFHIPAVTTDVSGFGMVVQNMLSEPSEAIYIVHRDDTNEDHVVEDISGIMADFSNMPEKKISSIRNEASILSKLFSWEHQIPSYKSAYAYALQKSEQREELFKYKPQAEPFLTSEVITENKPLWRNIAIKFRMPPALAALETISRNLWCTWDLDALTLFEYIDRKEWSKCNRNPILFIQSLSLDRIRELEKDKAFVKQLKSVEKKFDAYMSQEGNPEPLIAYFCMEYGIASHLKIYSGGLGVLAGDYMKEASDQGVNMVGIGLLYKNGYFKQGFSIHGEQYSETDAQDFSRLPVELVHDKNDKAVSIRLPMPGRTVYAQVWKAMVGRIPLYLLDTNVPENNPDDRNITASLYDIKNDNRLKQELVLGIGGIQLLNALEIKPDVYHSNEGHSAFMGIERLDNLIQGENIPFDEALEVVKSSTLFTTHTSVAAANDMFTEEFLRPYLAHKAQHFNISWDMFMGLGRTNERDTSEKFSMTVLASKLSEEINAVSKIHETVSTKLLNPLWKDYKPNELHITSVTNGVHYTTWTAPTWQQLYKEILGPQIEKNLANAAVWEQVQNIPNATIWSARTELKKALVNSLKNRLAKNIPSYLGPRKAWQIINNLDENALIIGFARRVTMYKRTDLIFYDLERLRKIVNDADRPVHFLFSGKAHPNDKISIDRLQHMLQLIETPELESRILFIEDYDIDLAKRLVQGVDIWLNTPNRDMEASGTSGMKAAMNGVLNLSVLDGWWAEAYNDEVGWALAAEPMYDEPEFQNQLDAEMIYSMLENDIIPMYFDRDEAGVPGNWVQKIKNSIAQITPAFNTTRMLHEYREFYYDRLHTRSSQLTANNFAQAKELMQWKRKIYSHWNEVDIISIEVHGGEHEEAAFGEQFNARIVISTGLLAAQDIGVDVIFVNKQQTDDEADDVFMTEELSLDGTTEHGDAIFACNLSLIHTGTYEYTFRVFPKHELLQYRQDFDLVKWV